MIVQLLKYILRPFLKKISFDYSALEKLKSSHQNKVILIISRRKSAISAAYFNIIQSIYFPERVCYVSGYNSKHKLDQALNNQGIIFLFLFEERHPDRLEHEFQSILKYTPIEAIPLFILWVKRVQYTSNFEYLDYPKGVYKLILAIFMANKARLRHCDSVEINASSSLNEFTEIVRQSYHREMTSVLGPRIRNRSEVIRDILSDRSFMDTMRKLQSNNTYKKVKEILYEIAANKRFSAVRKVDTILNFVWRFTIEGIYIDIKGINRVKELAKNNQIVYLPSHRSHADYLLIGQQLFKHDLDTPITAAGVNLAFFPIGNLFRRSGAFFIRRSFRGNRFYSGIFLKYLETMMMEGASQMFYIEGGRSRTGKLLSPKQGMLSMMLNVLRNGKVNDLYFVPMSVDYGKLFEGQSYIDELRGKDKQKESIFAMLDTFKFFKKRQGITYIQFAEPFSVRKYIESHGQYLHDIEDSNFSKIIDKLSEHIIYQINSVVTITPSAVISLTLLSNFRRGIQKTELMRVTKLIFHYLKTKNVRLPSIEENFETNFDNVLQTFEYNNYIQSIPYVNDSIVKINENSRPFLDYYKNNIIHLFLQMSFISLVIRNHESDEISVDEIEVKIEFFKRLFSYEFIYSDLAWNRQNLVETIKFLSLVKTVKIKENIVSRLLDRSSWLTILGNLILNFIESYFTVADYLKNHYGENLEIDLKTLIGHGQNLYAIGIINMNESISKENYQNALKYIRRNNVLQSRESIAEFRDSLLRYLL